MLGLVTGIISLEEYQAFVRLRGDARTVSNGREVPVLPSECDVATTRRVAGRLIDTYGLQVPEGELVLKQL